MAETLKEIAPEVTQALVLLDANIAANLAYLSAAETAGPSVRMSVVSGAIRDASEFEQSSQNLQISRMAVWLFYQAP